MHIILNILADFKKTFVRLFQKIKNLSRYAKIAILIGLILIIGIYFFTKNEVAPEVTSTTSIPAEVIVKPVAELSGTSDFATIGKVEALSEANLQTEAGGRITGVFVTVGDKVRAGMVIATIQNDIQRAGLLQAEGAYEAAKVASAQSSIGINQSENSVTSAINNAMTANRNAYNTANSVILDSLDQFYAKPTEGIIGLRVTGDTQYFNSERLHFREALSSWKTTTLIPLTEDNLLIEIDKSIVEIQRLRDLVGAFIKVTTSNTTDKETLNDKALGAYTAGLLSNESSLNATLANLAGAKTAFQNALEARKQANLTGKTGGEVISSASAQQKIALGQLRAAQANYEKTLVRSPLAGVVNALYLKVGDYVSPGQPAAIIANNNGLEVKTYVSESDSVNLKVGDLVKIEGNATGTISAKAGAIDPKTGKVEIRISVTKSLAVTNGATVRLFFVKQASADSPIVIPLTALKLVSSGPTIFTVTEDNKLSAVAVTLGKIIGENVVIESGLTKDMSIVVDARGLKNGDSVTVK